MDGQMNEQNGWMDEMEWSNGWINGMNEMNGWNGMNEILVYCLVMLGLLLGNAWSIAW